MSTRIQKAMIGGIAATIVMTIVMFLAPMMGMPKMNPPKMLAVTMEFPVIVGWVMHFMIGIIFALGYAYLFLPVAQNIKSKVLKGGIYGIIIFIFAQIMMQVMGIIFQSMPAPEGNMIMIIMGSVLGHIIFGIIVSLFFKE